MENWKLELWAGWYQKRQVFQWVTRMLPHQMLSPFFPILLFVAHHHIAWFFLCAECLIAWSAPPCRHALKATQFPEFSSTSKISSRLLHRCPLLAVVGLLTHVLKLGVVYYTLIGAARVWISDSISLNNSLLWQKTVDYLFAGIVVLWWDWSTWPALAIGSSLRDISPN